MDSQSQEKVVVDVGTWEQTFQELMQQVKPRARWTLKLDKNLQPNCVAPGWKQYQQRAFGRFQCSSCKRHWASAQVQILCHMYLDCRKSQGQVLMRHFAQRCRKCSRLQFQKPEFSPDSTMRILNNLVQRIQEKYYTDSTRKFREKPVILELPLEGPHDMANCEACILGFCVQSSQNCVTNSLKSPLSYVDPENSSPRIGDVSGQKQTRKQSMEALKAQGSGYSCGHNRARYHQATAGTQVPGAGSQPKWDTSQQPTPQGGQQAAWRTGPQSIQVARSLPPGWTDPQPKQAVGRLPSVWVDSKSTLETRPQVSQRTYSQVLRWAGQQSTQEARSRATQGAGQQSTQEARSRATQGAAQQSTQEARSRATQGAGQQLTQEVRSHATQGAGQQSTQEARSRATQGAGQQSTQEARSRATQGAAQQLTQEVRSHATQGAGQQSTQEARSRATQGAGQQSTQEARSHATQGKQSIEAKKAQQSWYDYEHNRAGPSHATAGTQVPRTGSEPKQETSQQPIPGAGQQSTQEAYLQVTRRAGLQTTWGTELQPDPTTTCRPGTFKGTQAAQRRQENYLPRGPASDPFGRPSSSVPPNDPFRQDNLFLRGVACVAVLWTIFVSKYFR